eukprot:10649102-Karenia_brevis.AAC.1
MILQSVLLVLATGWLVLATGFEICLAGAFAGACHRLYSCLGGRRRLTMSLTATDTSSMLVLGSG